MKTTKLAAISSLAILSLSGCSLLYPNWGATGLPTDSAVPTESATATVAPTESSAPTPTVKPKQPAQVQITMQNVDATAGTIGVVAQVSNVSEDGGLCTFKLVNGASTKTLTVKAESNVSTTQCYPMEVSTVGFPKGNATLTVSYDSVGYTGVSAPMTVNIP